MRLNSQIIQSLMEETEEAFLLGLHGKPSKKVIIQ